MAYVAIIDTIDLSALPPPEVVETLEYKQIYAENLQVFAAIEPEYALYLASDPVVKLIQAFSYREYLLRLRINKAAESLLIAKATKGNLDHLAANHNVKRLVEVVNPGTPEQYTITEQDASLRQRILLKIEAFSTAGPSGAYEFYARSASPRIIDALASSPDAGHVMVCAVDENYELSVELVNLIKAELRSEDRIPMTDYVDVMGPNILDTDIIASLVIFPGPDATVVLNAAKEALDKLLIEHRRIGRDLPKVAITTALKVTGVQNVHLSSPADDVVASVTQMVRVGNKLVTIAGIGD